MLWPFARRVVTTLPAIPARRFATAGLVALIGITLSVMVWMRADAQRRAELTATLAALADRSTAALEWSLEREVAGLRSLSAIWQVDNPSANTMWRFEAGMVLDQYPSIGWVAWVSRDSTQMGFVSRDTSARLDPLIVKQARFQMLSMTSTIQERWNSGYEYDAYFPVRSSTDSLGVVVGRIRLDSLGIARQPILAGFRSIRLSGDKGESIVLHALPDTLAPHWMRMQRLLTAPSGSTLTLDWVPSDEFVRQILTPWPTMFLLTGTFLSLALGVLIIAFLRLRDFSFVLQETNRALDAQLTELSRRDHELQVLNEQLGDRVEMRTAELSRALKELETFNHSVSHDLRSPVGAILNFTAVLEEDYGSKVDAEGRRFLERIRAAAVRANQLLDALAEFVASETAPDRTRVLDLKDLAERAYSEAVGREGVAGNVTFSVDPLPAALGDPALVHRVFVNLLGNALKYSRGRETRMLQVSGREDTTENIYAVRDNGRGFDPSRAAELFEPFRRLHGTDIEGSGLGLAIVAKIIGRLGGRVWAESDGANGATFYFSLPRAEENTNGHANDTAR